MREELPLPPRPGVSGVGVRFDAAQGRRSRITVLGRLNASTAPAFLQIVHSLVADGSRSVVVDLGGAEVSVAGVEALAIALAHVSQRHGELVLKSPRSHTLKLLSQAGVLDRFPVS